MTNSSNTTGVSMPDDFDVNSYDSVNRVVGLKAQTNRSAWDQFCGAWNAVSYRFRAVTDHSINFTEAIQINSDMESRYIQERELFSFFVSGLAVLESYFYAMFAAGAILNPTNFPFVTETDFKHVTCKETTKNYSFVFSSHNLPTVMQSLIHSKQFQELERIRNLLAHRIATTRIISLTTGSGSPAKPHEWRLFPGFFLDINTTVSRRIWLTQTLNELLYHTDDFAQKYFV